MKSGLSTTALHTGYDPARADGAVIPPLHLSTTFVHGNDHGYEYARSGNPTREVLEATLAALDGADHALAFSSGSAALVNVVALLGSDEKILFSSDAYGGTYRYVVQVAGKQGIGHGIVDFTDLPAVEAELARHAYRLIWLETPTNPLLKVADIAALAKLAHQHKALLIVDNTFATPVLQRPIAHGADVVAYSTTKFINGHSDSIGGSLVVKDPALAAQLRFLQNAIGAVLSPFDSWLTLRGLRTLELRLQRHVANAEALAGLLSAHPAVERVYYPGLFTGSQGDIVRRQMTGGGGIVSFELQPHADVQTFIQALKLIPLAESLGGVESLLDHPASMTHASLPPAERAKIGLSDGLFRLSVGIENLEDLATDLNHALKQSSKNQSSLV